MKNRVLLQEDLNFPKTLNYTYGYQEEKYHRRQYGWKWKEEEGMKWYSEY